VGELTRAAFITPEIAQLDGSIVSFSMQELEGAAEIVSGVLPPTPQYPWPKLRRRTGCTVWVKHENHTPTGAFKVRGGIVYMDRLSRAEPRVTGLVSATRGNHGQSVAFAAALAGIPTTIYVPHGNSPDQNSAMQAFGATVVETGKDFDEARHAAFKAAAVEGWHFVPPFHRDLVAGVASYALEFFRAVPNLDSVYVGVGMGSGICGLIAVRDLLGLRTEIIGVGAAAASATAQSFAAGRPIATQSALTFADGIATREPDADAIATICRGAARFVQVDEDSIAEAMRIFFDDTHQIAEGAGAAPLAALLQERQRMANRTVGVILTGGNIERVRLLQVLGGHTPSA
jgi:threonine dehydratase